uniref:DNA-directed RNA polymerase RBP11-like dimerisation domain-containing protein n=1 Tax=Lotharella vacuolata TaxID=74820 RepID=A0A0H5BJW4_9EUKA|nr:hypothetical protein [Lotharella vacuolata]
MSFTYKLLVEGENYTLGNLMMFFIKKNYLVIYSSYEILHPLREILMISITLKRNVKINEVLKESLKTIKIFLKIIIKIVMWNKKLRMN